MAAYTDEQILRDYPWLREHPGLYDQIQGWFAQGLLPDEILFEIRQTDRYRNRIFPGMFDDQGRMRFANEAEYTQTMRDHRTILRNYLPGSEGRYDSYREMLGLIEMDISPRELEDRLKTYHQIKNSSQPIKDAYYIYAGLELEDDQIYAAMVDPQAYRNLKRQYDARVANLTSSQQVFDRMTERTSANLGVLVSDMEAQGVISRIEADRLVQGINPQRVGRWINAMLTEAQQRARGGREFMGMADIQQALNYALVGSAATQMGFDLPDESRIAEYVDAGVDRAKALETYGLMARQGGFMAGAMQRQGLGGGTQRQLEQGLFGTDATAQTRLDWALRAEEARGAEQGGAGFGTTRQGQLVQTGLRASRTR